MDSLQKNGMAMERWTARRWSDGRLDDVAMNSLRWTAQRNGRLDNGQLVMDTWAQWTAWQ
jgi:hypothetical protein